MRESITRFIEESLHLRVNKEKTVSAYVGKVKYLGYTFGVVKGECRLRLHAKSKAKMRARLKELTRRSNGWGYKRRKDALRKYIVGWIGYYHLAEMKSFLQTTDEWLRRRIRMCIWKAWKRPRTRVKNLILCGIDKHNAYMWGNTSKSYWRTAGSWIMTRAVTNASLRLREYTNLYDEYVKWHPK